MIDLPPILLIHYKDDPDKLAKIMEKLLDREIHPLYKAPLLSSFYINPTPMGHSCTHGNRQHHHHVRHRGDLEAGMAAMALDRPASNGGSNSMTQRPTSGPSNHRDQIPTWELRYLASWTEFCVVTVNSVVSPFFLHEIAVEAAHFFAYTGSALGVDSNLTK